MTDNRLIYRQCEKCGLVTRTTGSDSMSEFHARRCDGTLADDGGCHAVIFHGPGHQSTTRCEVKDQHDVHEAIYGSQRQLAEWRGTEVFSGFFDEPPEEV